MKFLASLASLAALAVETFCRIGVNRRASAVAFFRFFPDTPGRTLDHNGERSGGWRREDDGTHLVRPEVPAESGTGG